MARAYVDKEKCIGCGTCEVICPETFEICEDGKAQVKKGQELNASKVQEAIACCPEGAISFSKR